MRAPRIIINKLTLCGRMLTCAGLLILLVGCKAMVKMGKTQLEVEYTSLFDENMEESFAPAMNKYLESAHGARQMTDVCDGWLRMRSKEIYGWLVALGAAGGAGGFGRAWVKERLRNGKHKGDNNA